MLDKDSLRVLREALQEKKRRLDEEIRGYPKPIPRCDAQFNRLFEDRDRLMRLLEQFNTQAL